MVEGRCGEQTNLRRASHNSFKEELLSGQNKKLSRRRSPNARSRPYSGRKIKKKTEGVKSKCEKYLCELGSKIRTSPSAFIEFFTRTSERSGKNKEKNNTKKQTKHTHWSGKRRRQTNEGRPGACKEVVFDGPSICTRLKEGGKINHRKSRMREKEMPLF